MPVSGRRGTYLFKRSSYFKQLLTDRACWGKRLTFLNFNERGITRPWTRLLVEGFIVFMQRACILVCGSHRCGTSAVTRVINLLGADIAQDLIPANSYNACGYWESASLITIHDDLFNSLRLQADPLDPLALHYNWNCTPAHVGECHRRAGLYQFGGTSR